MKFAHSMVVSLLIMASLAPVALSQNVSIDINVPDQFTTNESVFFNYTISSAEDAIISYIPSISCPSAPLATYQIWSSRVAKNQPLRGTYSEFRVTDDILPQTCIAEVSVIEPIKIAKQKTFSINANPKLKLDILLCKDENCAEESKIFLPTETVYVFYKGDAGITLDSSLTYPDSSVQKVSLPLTIMPAIGMYTLDVKARKTGYSRAEKTVQFAVIESPAEILLANECNADGICSPNENLQNCFQDCKPTGELPFIMVIADVAGAIAVIVGIILVLEILKRKRRSSVALFKQRQSLEKLQIGDRYPIG